MSAEEYETTISGSALGGLTAEAFASAWTFPGDRFTGAIVAGYRVAVTVHRDHSKDRVSTR